MQFRPKKYFKLSKINKIKALKPIIFKIFIFASQIKLKYSNNFIFCSFLMPKISKIKRISKIFYNLFSGFFKRKNSFSSSMQNRNVFN